MKVKERMVEWFGASLDFLFYLADLFIASLFAHGDARPARSAALIPIGRLLELLPDRSKLLR